MVGGVMAGDRVRSGAPGAFAPPPPTPAARLGRLAGSAAVCAALAVSQPVLAEGSMRGAKVFDAQCMACHAGGGNSIMYARGRTLRQKDLERFDVNSKEGVYEMVRAGKGAMPGYGTTLSKEEIEDVAEFVLERSAQGWK